MDKTNFVWSEKYRPKTVAECILPDRIKSLFQSYVDEKNIPNLILTGSPGVGKTTVAIAMLEELDCDYLKINSSLYSNKDVIRDDMMTFASSVSFKEGRKYILLDEFDGMRTDAQDALKAFIEEYSSNCGFILTCNNSGKIVDAIASRCATIDFSLTRADFPELAGKFYQRLETILKKEGIEYDKASVAGVMKKFYPDWRHMIVVLQHYSSKNKRIDSGILANTKEDALKSLVALLQGKKFTEMRIWVAENSSVTADFSGFGRKLETMLSPLVELKSIALYVEEYSDADFKSYFVSDKDANVAAFLTKLMAGLVWK